MAWIKNDVFYVPRNVPHITSMGGHYFPLVFTLKGGVPLPFTSLSLGAPHHINKWSQWSVVKDTYAQVIDAYSLRCKKNTVKKILAVSYIELRTGSVRGVPS